VNLTDVIESLVEERGLEREEVVTIVCNGFLAAYKKKFPDFPLSVFFDKKRGCPAILIQKTVVSSVQDEDSEISLRKAKNIKPDVVLSEEIKVPLEEKIGRIEVLVAKQIIAQEIKELEQKAIAEDFKEKEGTIISGVVHKKEQNGTIVKTDDVMALLPASLSIPGESAHPGAPIRALLKEVLVVPRGDFQLILDRASAQFVQRLLELEIPEVFEGIVEVKTIVRTPGYKTKIIVVSNSKEIDPVGTCVGVGGVRIKPILRELGGEKIDLIEWKDSLEALIKNALKPAEIDKVEVFDNGNGRKSATVLLAEDQRSLAIGKMGRNISLASRLTGVEINLQETSKSASRLIDSEEKEAMDTDDIEPNYKD
jgi:N utilization substance protein A